MTFSVEELKAKQREAEKLLEGITPFPWETWRYDAGLPLAVVQAGDGDVRRVVADMTNEENPDDPQDALNAAFIAAAPTLVRDLLSLSSAALEEIERLREAARSSTAPSTGRAERLEEALRELRKWLLEHRSRAIASIKANPLSGQIVGGNEVAWGAIHINLDELDAALSPTEVGTPEQQEKL